MRTRLASVAAFAAAAALAGCAGSQPGVPGGPLDPAMSDVRSSADLARTGAYPALFPLLRSRRQNRAAVRRPLTYAGPKDLFVTDRDLGNVLIFSNKGYTAAGSITDGTENGDGEYLDLAANLYVADTSGEIEEYAPNGASPSFTYNSGMTDPVNVSVDTKGNVYEADYSGKFVNQYAQQSNTVVNSCSPGGGVEGIAINRKGDVFVDYVTSTGSLLAEYKGGLSGCKEDILKPSFGFAGGMAIDTKGNLVVCDQQNARIDVVAPPYTSITGTLGSGFGTPLHISINKANNRAFVTDIYFDSVDIIGYPSGTRIKSLGSSNGLMDPWGVVDAENAVY